MTEQIWISNKHLNVLLNNTKKIHFLFVYFALCSMAEHEEEQTREYCCNGHVVATNREIRNVCCDLTEKEVDEALTFMKKKGIINYTRDNFKYLITIINDGEKR